MLGQITGTLQETPEARKAGLLGVAAEGVECMHLRDTC